MINLINFILTKYMGVLKKIYFLIFISCSFNTFIAANDDETEFVDDGIDSGYEADNEIDNDNEDIVDNEEIDSYESDDEIDSENEDIVDDKYDEIDSYESDYSNGNYDNDDYDENEDNNYKKNNINNNDSAEASTDAEDIDEKIEKMKNGIEKREEENKKKFFQSYNRLRRDVEIIKARDPHRGKDNGLLDTKYKKFPLFNIGLYGYCNIPRFLKYSLGKSNPKISEIIKSTPAPPTPGEVPKNIRREYLLSTGLCLNINIHSGGLSFVGGYCIFEDRLIEDTVDTYVGFNMDVLLRFPTIGLVDLIFNFLDPFGILLYFTGLRRRTEWLVGVKLCFYESKEIGKFDPGFKNHVFKDLKNLKDDTSKSSVQKIVEVLFKHCTIGRRVYINPHIFYSFSSSIIFPLILLALSKDCKEVGKFITDCKFTDSIINVSLGLLI